MTLLCDYRRVSRRQPCPICAKGDWCLVTRDNPPTKAICARIMSARRWGEAGWMHVLSEEPWRTPRARCIELRPRNNRPDLAALASAFTAALTMEHLAETASDLGVSTASLLHLRAGWTGRAISFPMVNGAGAVTGIRLRTPCGRKLAIRGGQEGLFVPSGLTGQGPLIITEGPTDTAAVMDLGMDAVGRPSCTGGVRLLASLVRDRRPGGIVILADGDPPGQRGARQLAVTMACYCRCVRVVTPPPPFKDARAWVKAGAGRHDLEKLIDGAAPIVLGIRIKGGRL